MALCAVFVLLFTLPGRIARLVAEELARHLPNRAGALAETEEIKAIAGAHRALLAEQWRIAATLRGLADWLVRRALGGAPARWQASRPSALVGERAEPRVVVPGPWRARRPEPGVEVAAPEEQEGGAAS
jgi:hypothetical protein